MKDKIFGVANKLNHRIFGFDIGETMIDFLNGLSWSYIGIFGSSLIMFILSIIAGRFLGPVEYGKYNLILAMSNIVVIFIFFGLDATSVKYVAGSNSSEEKNQHISNSLIVIVITNIFFLSILLLTSSFLQRMLHIDKSIILFVLLFSFLASFKSILDSIIKALKDFRFQATLKIIESLIIILCFILLMFILRLSPSFKIYVLSMSAGALIIIICYLRRIKDRLVPWSATAFKQMVPYLKLSIPLSILGAISSNYDKLFVGRYMNARELGIYSAYLTASVIIFSQISAATFNVLFPLMNKIEDKHRVVKKINHLFKIAFVPGMIFIIAVSYVVMRLFGRGYGINWLYLFLTAIVSYLQILVVCYSSVVSSSNKLLSYNIRFYYLKPLFLAGLYVMVYVLNKFTIPYVLIILILSFIYDIFTVKYTFKFAEKSCLI